MIRFAQSAHVKVFGVRPEVAMIMPVLDGVFSKFGYDCMITSCTEGKHGFGSLHFNGSALDLRIRHITHPDEVRDIVRTLKDSLTVEFDVVLEGDHIHIEFQPKTAI